VYHEQTAPVSQYYADLGVLKQVDGMLDMDAVTQEIEAALDVN
jgi:adenylate kinase